MKESRILKERRWLRVLRQKAIRLGVDPDGFGTVQVERPVPNVRLVAKLYWNLRESREEGYDMATAMDGSGECGHFIYGRYEEEKAYDVESACKLAKEDVLSVLLEVRMILKSRPFSGEGLSFEDEPSSYGGEMIAWSMIEESLMNSLENEMELS